MIDGRLFRRMLVAALALTACGCIPWRFSGYEPSGPGQREPGFCVAGIHTRLKQEALHGVGVHWQADRDDGADTVLLHVYLTVPAGVVVRLQSADLVFRGESWPEPRHLTVQAITAPGPDSLPVGAELIGPADPARGQFDLWFFPERAGSFMWTGIPAAPEFSIALPLLTIDGEAWQAPPVTFKAFSRWGIYTCVQ